MWVFLIKLEILQILTISQKVLQGPQAVSLSMAASTFQKGFKKKKIDFLRKKFEKCILVNFSKMEEATIRTCTLQTGSQDCESGLFEYPVLFPRIKNMCQLMHTVVFLGRTGGGESEKKRNRKHELNSQELII